MLEAIRELPDGVIGFVAKGKLHTSDYTDVLQPAIRQVLDRGDDVRIVLVFESFDGMSAGAVGQDLKMGVGHLNRWKRIALVTDVERMIHMTSLFGWMTPGELKHFPLAQRDEAIRWTAGEPEPS
jgi:SpoIIAA-like